MRLELSERSYVVLDLDDTLYPEADFVRSGIKHIGRLLAPVVGEAATGQMLDRFSQGQEYLKWAEEKFKLPPELGMARLLEEYRTHYPSITLRPDAREFLARLSSLAVSMGLVTDGRTVTQRNKLKALGIEDCFDHVAISEELGSEKPDPRNYRIFETRAPDGDFIFIGDNTTKDFQVPAELGWQTICIKDAGDNIHGQDFACCPRIDHIVSSFAEIELALVS